MSIKIEDGKSWHDFILRRVERRKEEYGVKR